MSIRANDESEPVAVTGLGCRFPGAEGPAAFWDLLGNRRDAVTTREADRASGRTGQHGPGGRGGFLEDVDRFDAGFFGISPREAERLDPQQRLLLEVTWEALEDAALVPARLDGSATGVFVGMWINDYESRMFSEAGPADFHMTTGSGRYTAAGRLSHLLGLRGPSLTVDTACSSSLVAVHLACQSLWSGEAELAIAAGVNVILQPHITTAYTRSGMLSADGRCKFGDARADGYVRSEGIGVVVLKSLASARRDRDPIHAVILGSAVNNDGRTGGSLGTPGRAGQEALLRAAYRRAGVAPAAVQYVEAHGTGTRAGDPVELSALGAVLGRGRPAGRPCFVGSVKTNIGHTEGAAGIAGLIKVALSLEHRTIPASLHCETPTPEVAWSDLGVTIPSDAIAWPAAESPVAGVSSFGIGGTNAHVVLGAAPADAPDPEGDESPTEYLLPLSARSPEALGALAESYVAHLSRPGPATARDTCFTAGVRRGHHEYRLAVVGRDRPELAARLAELLRARSAPALVESRPTGRAPRVAFVFPGQGSQWPGMALGLLAAEPEFRSAIERCDAAIAAQAGWSLLEELQAGERSSLDRIDVVQPTLFAIQVALAAQWRAWGVEPAAVVGHSMGEVAAAHVAGALDLDAAARVICTRSALLRRISGRGAMAVVELAPSELRGLLRGQEHRLAIAVCNSERSTVVAGEVGALEDLLGRLEREGVFCRLVKVDVASHSPQVDPLREDLLRGLAGLAGSETRIPMCSTVTGAPVDGRQLDAAYWMRNLRDTVQFGTAVRRLRETGCDAFIEISPHPVLLPAIEQGLDAGRSGLCLPSLRRQEPERAVLLESLGALYRGGYPVDWARLYPTAGRCVSLPAYPWQRERFWFPAAPGGDARHRAPDAHPLLGEHIVSSAAPGTHFWQDTLDPARVPWLLEHRVLGTAVLPASAIVEMALGAAARVFGSGPASVEDVRFDAPLTVTPPRLIQLVVDVSAPGTATFRLASRAADDAPSSPWTVHATGGIRRRNAAPTAPLTVTGPDPRADGAPGEHHYAAMSRRGLEYGPAFRGVASVSVAEGVVFTRLHATDAVSDDAGRYVMHPCRLDAALQGVIAALDSSDAPPTATYVPASVDRVIVHPGPVAEGDIRCRVTVRGEAADETRVADVLAVDSSGQPVVDATGVRVTRLAREAAGLDRCRFEVQWRRQPPSAGGHPEAPGRWVVLADRRGVGEALARRLSGQGARCALAFAHDEGIQAVLADAAAEPLQGIAYLWGLDTPSLTSASPASITESAAVQQVVALIKMLATAEPAARPRLVLVTAGVQEITGIPGPTAVEQAPLWGAGAVLAREHPELSAARVDLSGEPSRDEIDGLASACLSPDGEGQIALRGRDRYVARLERIAPGSDRPVEPRPVSAGSIPFRAHASAIGTLDGLSLRPLARRSPGPGEIEIEVRAVGLNFMDVMSALGSLPGHPNGVGPIGIECAGRVVAAGPGVRSPSPGDEVVAIAFDCLGTHVVTDARLAAARPEDLDDAAAATLPIAFLTASYALEDLARLRGGERVLIHAAAGGVGLAAVQLARRAGATVFATAGSPPKHEYLRTLGVEHVLDSRSLSFARDVKLLTGGVGVDVVLNSLAGDAVAAGLSTLAPYGRFVEIGKRDIYQNASLPLGPFRSNLSYAALDLERMCRERPAVVGDMLARLMKRVAAGEIRPIPVRVFPIGQVTEAFRYMAEARHIGKIALSLSREHAAAAPLAVDPAALRPDATYLITGGLGALGLAMADALVDAGARHVALLGRRPPGESARRAIEALERRGAEVVTVAVDVAAPGPMTDAIASLRRRMPGLRGVIHAAGVLDDATLLRMEPAQIRAVMGPKATGAWVLHSLTEPDALDFFVLCSSASAVLGLAGQANYAAANAFLDALARHRRSLGRPALSIAWGPWRDIGLAAASAERGARLEGLGLGSLSPEQGIPAFISLLGSRRANEAVMVFDVDAWIAALGRVPDPFLGALLQPGAGRGDEAGAALADVVRAAPAAARLALLRDHLTARVARILRLEPGRVDPEAPLKSLGLDSLMTLELRNRLEADSGLRLSATLVWNYPTIAALAGYIGAALGLGADPVSPVAVAAVAGSPDREDLSREQVGALLTEELARVNRLLGDAPAQGHD